LYIHTVPDIVIKQSFSLYLVILGIFPRNSFWGVIMAKATGGKIASTAGRTLGNPGASKIQRSLAGSALAQAGTAKVTSKAMETKASAALQSQTSSATTKALAGSVVAQAKKNP
jgi:glycosyltransferase A (GT-A) superfamily protein (DUF2064 family)